MKYRFGLIRGEGPLSRSPELYRALWAGHSLESELHYEPIVLEARTDWTNWLHQAHEDGWMGFNVTIPHKIDVFRSVPERSDAAKAIGATNCLVRTADGWMCHNTDADGFWFSWRDAWGDSPPRSRTAWLLGNGGAARAIAYVLQREGFDVWVFARTERPDFLGLTQHDFAATAHAPRPSLVVQATSLGHQVDSAPPVVWPDLHGAWAVDAVYGPQPTRFQREAAAAGARVLDGMPMLRMQAKKAWEYWAGMLGMSDF